MQTWPVAQGAGVNSHRRDKTSREQGATLLFSLESSAFTAILTPRTLISRTQLEGGLKCTVRRRVVAIWG